VTRTEADYSEDLVRLRRFAADTAHDLRAPLQAITGFAQLLARREGWRREQFAVLLGRIDPRLTDDHALLDLLVATTSFPTYDRLCGKEHSPEAVAGLLTRLVDALL